MRARWQGSCLWVAVLLVAAGLCHAQSVTPDLEYQKLIQVESNLSIPWVSIRSAKIINPYDGSLSFSVTDVSLRGNGPTITIGRTLQSYEWPSQFKPPRPIFPFDDWDLDIPRIESLVASTGSTFLQGPILGGTGDTGTTQRCTNFYQPPGISAAPLAEGGWIASEVVVWLQTYFYLVKASSCLCLATVPTRCRRR